MTLSLPVPQPPPELPWDQIREALAGIGAPVTVTTKDQIPLVHYGFAQEDAERLSALGAFLLADPVAFGRRIGMGRPESVIARFPQDNGALIVSPVTACTALVVLAAPGQDLGEVNYHISLAIEALENVLPSHLPTTVGGLRVYQGAA